MIINKSLYFGLLPASILIIRLFNKRNINKLLFDIFFILRSFKR